MEASVAASLCHSKLLSISCGSLGKGAKSTTNNLPHTELVKEWDTPIVS